MKICPRCGIPGDVKAFFPPESNQKWCRDCVSEIVTERYTSKEGSRIQKQEREQKAIRALISQLQSDKSFVYLIEGPGGYKIGYSKNVARRAEQLNTAMSVTCKVIAMVPGDSKLERNFHHKHRFKRLNREWFAQSPQILRDFIRSDGVFVFLPGYMKPEAPSPSPCVNGGC